MRVFLVIGECGSGKTWVMKELIKKFKLNTPGKVGMFYFHRNENVVCLGKYDGSTFEGSDKLSMAIMSDVKSFHKYAKDKNATVFCEGDRFMNETFVKEFNTNLWVVHITNDGKEGRKKRKSAQTERHLKSISTRVKNFSKRAKFTCIDSKQALKTICDNI